MISLSIIVPVYNVEKYIHSCLQSIFQQGLEDTQFEVIIVNDGTTDNSMAVLADIISLHSNIVILNQQNQGIAVARNNGISSSKGKYILMVDSDDMLVKYSLKPLLNKALETNVDIAVARYTKIGEEIKHIQQPTNTSIKETNGKQLFLKGFKNYVWHKLYKKQFLDDHNIRFIPGIYFEDMPFTHECYLKAGRCLESNSFIYLYRERAGSITHSYFDNEKRISSIIAITRTMELKSLTNNDVQLKDKFQAIAYTNITKFVCTIVHCKIKRQEREQAIDALLHSVPNISYNKNIKQRIISYMLRHMPHTYIESRYYYGKIIEDNLIPLYHKIKEYI